MSDSELKTVPEKLIRVKSMSQVLELRKKLYSFLWGQAFLSAPVVEYRGRYNDVKFSDIKALRKIERLCVVMEFGIKSNIYHFFSRRPNGRVFLYHQGHRGDFLLGRDTISAFLDAGYDVVAFCLPLVGRNNKPTVFVPRIGNLKLTHHNILSFVEPEKGSALKFFVEPVVAVINYLEKEYSYSDIFMAGISGGGWATTLSAALDPRIRMSFSVAGSYPIYLRQSTMGWDKGDWEQSVPEFYRTANYLELYLLASAGHGRRHCKIINRYDPICFFGTKARSFTNAVLAALGLIGQGSYELWIDESHRRHEISVAGIKKILDTAGR